MSTDSRWKPEENRACLSIRHYSDQDHTCPPDPLLHLDGIPWDKAEAHAPWRRCRPQTIGFGIERCSCGAIRHMGMRGWLERRWFSGAIEHAAERLKKRRS